MMRTGGEGFLSCRMMRFDLDAQLVHRWRRSSDRAKSRKIGFVSCSHPVIEMRKKSEIHFLSER